MGAGKCDGGGRSPGDDEEERGAARKVLTNTQGTARIWTICTALRVTAASRGRRPASESWFQGLSTLFPSGCSLSAPVCFNLVTFVSFPQFRRFGEPVQLNAVLF